MGKISMGILSTTVATVMFCSKSWAIESPPSKATCNACHGELGISPNDLWPNIAGQKRGYLRAQLLAFRSGARVNSLMSPISQMLSDADIDELAQFFSSLGPTPCAPESK